MAEFDPLKLENQLCFPLYVCSKEIVRRYKPVLDKLDLTYTQYIVMLTLWEYRKLTVKELGAKLFLDSGTLTPVLKKLESKKYIVRNRSKDDERNLIVEVTASGQQLREQAVNVPKDMRCCFENLELTDMVNLKTILLKLMDSFAPNGDQFAQD